VHTGNARGAHHRAAHDGCAVIPKNANGPRAAAGAGGRDVRFREVLARWPVLQEDWARSLEARRTHVDTPVPPAARTGANAADAGITPLEAINRALGLPDDHGADEIVRRREGG